MNFIRKFMTGRYGMDQLGMAIITVCVILSLVSSIAKVSALSVISVLLLAFYVFRILSRNYHQRQKENLAFLKLYNPVRNYFTGFGRRFKDRKTHKYMKCPFCRAGIRLPRGKGKIAVTCPKCGKRFETKT